MCSSHDGTIFQNDSRSSLTMTLAQGDYCKKMKLDPQDPICAQVTLVGRMERVSCVVPQVLTNLEISSPLFSYMYVTCQLLTEQRICA
jgi:hypothetical protein